MRDPRVHPFSRTGKIAFAILVTALVLVNASILATAIPETSKIDSGCCAPHRLLAKDFSAFYIAAWRFLNDPSQIYTKGNVSDGEPSILPQPQGFKYLPSFLLFIFPLLSLTYNTALLAFDFLQFLLLPIIAFLIYGLLKRRGFLAASLVAAAVILLPIPLPTPDWSLSASYFWQWAEGQSKVLETFLLLLSLALSRSGRPRLAGAVFGVASFDVRFALLGLPLLATYSKRAKVSLQWAVGTFVLSNAVLLYPPAFGGFISMVSATGLQTPLYYYAYIPVVALAALWIVDGKDVYVAARRWVSTAISRGVRGANRGPEP